MVVDNVSWELLSRDESESEGQWVGIWRVMELAPELA